MLSFLDWISFGRVASWNFDKPAISLNADNQVGESSNIRTHFNATFNIYALHSKMWTEWLVCSGFQHSQN